MIKIKVCSSCNSEFNCNLPTGNFSCWCSAFPNIIPLTSASDCLCLACLKISVKKKINSFVLDYRNGVSENLAVKFKSDKNVLVEDIDFYKEKGFMVFTEWYHLKRGSCCGNGCRHCPYKKSRN